MNNRSHWRVSALMPGCCTTLTGVTRLQRVKPTLRELYLSPLVSLYLRRTRGEHQCKLLLHVTRIYGGPLHDHYGSCSEDKLRVVLSAGIGIFKQIQGTIAIHEEWTCLPEFCPIRQ